MKYQVNLSTEGKSIVMCEGPLEKCVSFALALFDNGHSVSVTKDDGSLVVVCYPISK